MLRLLLLLLLEVLLFHVLALQGLLLQPWCVTTAVYPSVLST